MLRNMLLKIALSMLLTWVRDSRIPNSAIVDRLSSFIPRLYAQALVDAFAVTSVREQYASESL